MSGDKKLVTEISITVKDEEAKLVEKCLFYNDLIISKENIYLHKIIEDAVVRFGNSFGKEAPEIIIKTKTVWQ